MTIRSDKFINLWARLIGYKPGELKGVSILFFIILATDASDKTWNHERIHRRQRGELSSVGAVLVLLLAFAGKIWGYDISLFWLLLILLYEPIYLIEWFYRRFRFGAKNANRFTVFEKEAYENQKNMNYLHFRSFLAWIKYY